MPGSRGVSNPDSINSSSLSPASGGSAPSGLGTVRAGRARLGPGGVTAVPAGRGCSGSCAGRGLSVASFSSDLESSPRPVAESRAGCGRRCGPGGLLPSCSSARRSVSRYFQELGTFFFSPPSPLAAQVTFPGKPLRLAPSQLSFSPWLCVKEYFAPWHVYINSSLLFPPPPSSFRHSLNGFETTGAGFFSCAIL